ncbi:MAG: Electron transport complex protein RnfD [Planctomycetes bacterium ADurb.Bin412]|nr:MAG: Electron transport complex protein RnfD [Planctomycetes bacterium ADurb.Bin412]
MAAVGTEWIFNAVRKKEQTIFDCSVLVTAMILGLSLPPSFPWWAAVLGTIVAVAVAKMIFGGLGSNIFNPAMVGRAFLMACFGTMMTTWTAPIYQQMVAADGSKACCQSASETCACKAAGKAGCGDKKAAAMTQATPLALAKQAIKDSHNPDKPAEQKQKADTVNQMSRDMFLGKKSGSLGETSALLWLAGGLFLLFRRTITWHIPLAVLASAAGISALAWWMNPQVYADPLVHLSGGGLMMCAFFIATDPVTCPVSKSGRVVFGIGVGSLIMLIRLKGGYPEGVMYAVLLMNAITPLLDRWLRPTPLGGRVKR